MTFRNSPSSHGKSLTIANFSVLNRDSVFFGRACEDLKDIPVQLTVICADSEEMDADEEKFAEFLVAVRGADIVLGRLHGDDSQFKKYRRLKELLDRTRKDMLYVGSLQEANEENRHRFRHSDDDYRLAMTLYAIGGKENHKSLALWICKTLCNISVEVPMPVRNLTEGYYIPGIERPPERERILGGIDPSKPTVGVLIHNTSILKKRTHAVDDLVAYLESHGANVLAVFFESSPDDITGSIGIRKTVEKYFYNEGRPMVDVIVLTSGFSQISMSDPMCQGKVHNFFEDLGVPVIQAISVMRTLEEWKADVIGLSSAEIGTSVVWPEFDGQIISVPLSFSIKRDDGAFDTVSIPDRVERISTLALAWARLRSIPAEERRVAILLNMYPPTNDRVGGAAGLDTFESIRNCIIAMDAAGYSIDRIPENGNEVVSEVLAGVTSDLEWVPEDEIEDRAADMVGMEQYWKWFSAASDAAREGMVRSWGVPPGVISVHDGKFVIPGVRNGNLFIGIQPNRGQHEQAETLYHDPRVVMPHQYLAYYRWLKFVFKADCIVHMGTHGTLEWLPGKGNGLSRDCYPDVILDTMPNVYPYIINDPGEGVQCKRRANSVLIGHMCPSMTRAGNYDDLADMDGKLQEYLNSENTGQKVKSDSLVEDIHRMIAGADMFKELGLDPGCGIEDVAGKMDLIYDYVSDLKDALIKDGLHILGNVPEGERLIEMVYSLCRLRNGDVPSLRAAVAKSMGFDLDVLLNNPSSSDSRTGRLNGTLIDEIDAGFNSLLDAMYSVVFGKAESLVAAERMLGSMTGDLEKSVSYVCDTIYPGIVSMTDEITYFMEGISGGYVPPGPSGSPTRGNAHLLPMGRNFYSIDPDAIPTEASWKVGKKMAYDMVERFVADCGHYPESIGIVIWATDTMKTCGDDVAYVFSLMGVRPTWGSVGGRVLGLEVIPLEELKRPRIDVVCRISGLFRDSFPGIVDMFAEAASMISDLDEADSENYYKKHLSEDIRKYISEGLSAEEANDMARIRVFGDPPGQHGNGVSVLIASSKWETLDQIAETYATWGAYAYGGKWKGERVTKAFKKRMGDLDVTVKNHNDREFDLLDIDDDYDSLGGMNAAVRVFGKHMPYSVMGDSSDVDRLKTRTLEEETAYVMRSRVLNPKWFEGLKPHGYKGAMEISKLTEYVLGWSATSSSIEPWMFKAIKDRFISDEGNRKWIQDNNPYAMKEMIEDLLEAIERELWDAPDDIRKELRDLYLEAEGAIEESAGIYGGDTVRDNKL